MMSASHCHIEPRFPYRGSDTKEGRDSTKSDSYIRVGVAPLPCRSYTSKFSLTNEICHRKCTRALLPHFLKGNLRNASMRSFASNHLPKIRSCTKSSKNVTKIYARSWFHPPSTFSPSTIILLIHQHTTTYPTAQG